MSSSTDYYIPVPTNTVNDSNQIVTIPTYPNGSNAYYTQPGMVFVSHQTFETNRYVPIQTESTLATIKITQADLANSSGNSKTIRHCAMFVIPALLLASIFGTIALKSEDKISQIGGSVGVGIFVFLSYITIAIGCTNYYREWQSNNELEVINNV